ncbi:MAG: MFS transporter [Tepidiformaceae bacterium]
MPDRLASSRFQPLMARQFSSLGVYNYRLYFFGQTISQVGTWMQTTAQAWLVLQISDSATALGVVTALQFLPITLLTLFGGVIADRLPKREVLILTQTLALVQAVILGVLVATGTVQLWHIYVLALWLGTVNALDGPVRQAFVVELVGREQLVNAVALNSSTFNAARIVGPAVAGVTIAVVGISTAFFLNAASYVAVIAAYFMMHTGEFQAQNGKRSGGNVLQQLGEGLTYSWRTPAVLFFFILLFFIGTFGYNFSVVIPLVAEFVLHVGSAKFGLLTSCMGAGSLVAALALAAKGETTPRFLLISTALFVAVFAGVAASHSFLLTSLLLVLLGAAGVAFSTTINTSLQIIVPDELRGRVMSIFFLLFAGSTPIGGYVTGKLGSVIGVPETLAIEAVACGVGLAIAIAYRAMHDAEFREAAVARAGREAAGTIGGG